MPATSISHVPCERRVDGERVTELIPAREWLSRQDANMLRPDERKVFPPALPRYGSRDHLHDRNRELCVFDPASPGLVSYVRVTRRRNPDPRAEANLIAQRKDRLLQQAVVEDIEKDRANELLELRSQNLRKLIQARSRGWDRGADVAARAPPDAEQVKRDNRIGEIETQMRRIRAMYEYKGYSRANAPPPATAPAPASARPKRPALRGGWPVDQEPYKSQYMA